MRFVCCLFFPLPAPAAHTHPEHHRKEEERSRREIIDFPNEGCVWVFMGITVRTFLLPLWEKELIYRRFFFLLQQQLNGKYLAICAAKIYCHFLRCFPIHLSRMCACLFVCTDVCARLNTLSWISEGGNYLSSRQICSWLFFCRFSQKKKNIYFLLIDFTRKT